MTKRSTGRAARAAACPRRRARAGVRAARSRCGGSPGPRWRPRAASARRLRTGRTTLESEEGEDREDEPAAGLQVAARPAMIRSSTCQPSNPPLSAAAWASLRAAQWRRHLRRIAGDQIEALTGHRGVAVAEPRVDRHAVERGVGPDRLDGLRQDIGCDDARARPCGQDRRQAQAGARARGRARRRSPRGDCRRSGSRPWAPARRPGHGTRSPGTCRAACRRRGSLALHLPEVEAHGLLELRAGAAEVWASSRMSRSSGRGTPSFFTPSSSAVSPQRSSDSVNTSLARANVPSSRAICSTISTSSRLIASASPAGTDENAAVRLLRPSCLRFFGSKLAVLVGGLGWWS